MARVARIVHTDRGFCLIDERDIALRGPGPEYPAPVSMSALMHWLPRNHRERRSLELRRRRHASVLRRARNKRKQSRQRPRPNPAPLTMDYLLSLKAARFMASELGFTHTRWNGRLRRCNAEAGVAQPG